MEVKSATSEQHNSAARHHDGAAHSHREAAKALDAGKPDQAATHAKSAETHLGHAVDSATQINKAKAAPAAAGAPHAATGSHTTAAPAGGAAKKA